MVCILGEMIRESGVKLAKEISCQMRGMTKRKLLCSVMKHTGFIVKKFSEKIQDCQCKSNSKDSKRLWHVSSPYCDVIERF